MSPSEKDLPTSEASYSDLFFRLLDPAFVLDAETLQILALNRAAEKALKETPDSLRSRPILDWIPAGLRPEFEKQARITLRRYHPRKYEGTMMAPNGSDRPCAFEFCELRGIDGAARLIQLIAHDLTAQREAEKRAENYLKKLESTLDELETANKKLGELAITDELTGVHNVRHFRQRHAVEHQRSKRFRRPYAIVFLDLDHFKQFNDRNGHPAGDALLAALAKKLKEISRETDCLARYGGEEFVILAPETDEAQAGDFAERLRKAVEELAFPNSASQPLGRISVSIGVASFPASGKSPEAVLQAADQAMYHSKKGGRNRVSLFSGITLSAP